MVRARSGFTTRGACLLAAGTTALCCGVLFGATDLTRTGVFLLALPTLAALVAHRARVGLQAHRSVFPPEVGTGEPIVVRIALTNHSALRTGPLALADQLPAGLDGAAHFLLNHVGGDQTRTITYRISRLPRGRHTIGPLRLQVHDAFGLVEVARDFSDAGEVVVGPIIEPLPRGDPPPSHEFGADADGRSIGAHGTEDASTREYRTGDPMRKVHWRTSARSAQLMVRQEEQPRQGATSVFVDLRARAHHITPAAAAAVDPRGTDSLEWALSAAASIAAHQLLAGQRVSILTDSPTRLARVADPSQVRRLLAEVAPSSAATLAGVHGLLQHAGVRSNLIAILGRLDHESLSLLATIDTRACAGPPTAILLDTSAWAGAAARPVDHPTATAAAMLRQSGWRVGLVRPPAAIAEAWAQAAGTRAPIGAPR